VPNSKPVEIIEKIYFGRIAMGTTSSQIHKRGKREMEEKDHKLMAF